jgi:hypothetical protein
MIHFCIVLLLFFQLTILFNMIFYKDPEQNDGVPYPGWALAMGWLIALTPVIGIPGWFLYKFCTGGAWQVSVQHVIK